MFLRVFQSSPVQRRELENRTPDWWVCGIDDKVFLLILFCLLQLAKDGLNVVLISRSEAKLQDVAKEIGEYFNKYYSVNNRVWQLTVFLCI